MEGRGIERGGVGRRGGWEREGGVRGAHLLLGRGGGGLETEAVVCDVLSAGGGGRGCEDREEGEEEEVEREEVKAEWVPLLGAGSIGRSDILLVRGMPLVE